MGLRVRPPVGTKVRLTGKFLQSTGQQTGSEGTSRWLTVDCGKDSGCDCEPSYLVAVNEPHLCGTDPRGYEDVLPEVRARMWRHIALANLEIIGAKPKAEDYP
jgi:hypothetical protein